MTNIKTIRICSTCGGMCSLTTNECIYCGSLNENLKNEMERITDEIKQISFENISDENMDYVIFLYGYEEELSKLDSLKDIYINNNINKIFDDMLSNINGKLNSSSEYTELEKRFLSENILNNPKFQYNYENILREILLGNKLIIKEAFKEIIRNEVTNILKNLYPNLINSKSMAICEFKDMNDCGGVYKNSYKSITIDNETIDALYNSSIDGLHTLYHELYHSIQHFKVDNFYNDFETMYDTKEFLLFESLKDYYKDNYEFLMVEKDANIFAHEAVKLSLKRLGLKLSDEKLKSEEEKNKQEMEKKKINIRKYNDEEIDFDDLFDKTIISHPEWLEKYPQLNIEYIVDNDSVRRKTKEEFIEYVMHNPKIDETYFQYLIEKFKDENEKMKI